MSRAAAKREYGDPGNPHAEIKTWGAYDQYAQAYLEETIAVRRILLAERKINDSLRSDLAEKEAEIEKLRLKAETLRREVERLQRDVNTAFKGK